MKLLLLLLLVQPYYAQPCYAQLVIASPTNGSQTNFAPGSLVLVAADGLPDLSTATLTISPAITVPILSAVSPGIFLARLPADLPLGQASAYATINGTNTQPTSLLIVPSSFGIFTGPISAGYFVSSAGLQSASGISVQPGLHFAQKNSGPLVGLAQPAHPGDYLTFWGTGLGNATPDQVSVSFAGLPIPVTYAGPAPGEPGVDQINVLIPPGLAAPDSCYDSFAVTVADTSVPPKALSYTQNAPTCPSPFGFNATELAKIDAGSQVSFVQLSLQSSIRPATSSDNVGTGFTRSEFTEALQQSYNAALPPLDFADSVLYSCQSQQVAGVFAFLARGYQGLFFTMGSTPIPIDPVIYDPPPLPAAVPTPDLLPPSIFQPGTWQLTAPNFSQPIQVSPPIQLQNFAALQSIDTTRDLTVTWNPTGYSASDVVTLSIGGPRVVVLLSASSFSWPVCRARATNGSITIPAAQLQSIPTSSTLTASVSAHPDQTPNFRLPQPDGSTLPLQFTYNFSETFPITLH